MKLVLIILLLLLGGAAYWAFQSVPPKNGSQTTAGAKTGGSSRLPYCGTETGDNTKTTLSGDTLLPNLPKDDAFSKDDDGSPANAGDDGGKATLPSKIEDDENKNKGKSLVMSKEKAEELARKEIEGKINIPPNTPVEVRTDNDGNYVVTFKTVLKPDERGADYHAQVTVDGKTGKILNILSGS
jgi:hypothetical protein